MILKPPHNLSNIGSRFSVFLAGSIEMGVAENWQEKVEAGLYGTENICILNPRRNDWDANWKQEIENAEFNEQVSWELDALEKANLIIFYFSPETRSPVSMLELGLFARSGKVIVCCPQGFWRKGNVDIICKKYGIEQVNTIAELIQIVRLKNRSATI